MFFPLPLIFSLPDALFIPDRRALLPACLSLIRGEKNPDHGIMWRAIVKRSPRLIRRPSLLRVPVFVVAVSRRHRRSCRRDCECTRVQNTTRDDTERASECAARPPGENESAIDADGVSYHPFSPVAGRNRSLIIPRGEVRDAECQVINYAVGARRYTIR